MLKCRLVCTLVSTWLCRHCITGTERMPRNELHHCAGLAFLFTTKGGIVLSVESGHGFVIQKLTPSAGTRWSAPLFFKSYGSSVGITLGVSVVDAVIVLDTPEAVAAFHQRSQVCIQHQQHWLDLCCLQAFTSIPLRRRWVLMSIFLLATRSASPCQPLLWTWCTLSSPTKRLCTAPPRGSCS